MLKEQKTESKVGFTQSIKYYDFPNPNINFHHTNNQITLSTKTPAFQVYLHGINGSFSDNYFTLLPGKEKLIDIMEEILK